jgi:hypothetical protein
MTDRAHVVLVLITAGMLGFVLHLMRSGRLRAKYAMLWTTVGAGLVVLAAFPGLLDWTAVRLGIYYPPAAFLMAAVAFLFVLTVHFSWELSRLEERTRTLAEEIALLRNELEGRGGPKQAEPPGGGAEAADGDTGEGDAADGRDAAVTGDDAGTRLAPSARR